jgi:hypothetical protein
MLPLDDDNDAPSPVPEEKPFDGETDVTPYVPEEPARSLPNIGAILSLCAVGLAAIGSILPFISLPGGGFQNGSPSDVPSSVVQFLSRALYSSFLNALPTVWFFSMALIALVTIVSIAGLHFRALYVGQVILSVFALFWGFMTVMTFAEPRRFDVDDHLALNGGFFCFALAFIVSSVAGIISVRWSERLQQRDLLKSLNRPGT